MSGYDPQPQMHAMLMQALSGPGQIVPVDDPQRNAIFLRRGQHVPVFDPTSLPSIEDNIAALENQIRACEQQIAMLRQAAAQARLDEFASWKANFRAYRLLWKHMSPAQREQWKEPSVSALQIRSFIARGNMSGDHFRVHLDASVHRIRDQHNFCLIVGGPDIPIYDQILAKKLLLENDERIFLGTANDLTDRDGMINIAARMIAQDAFIPRRARRAPETPTPGVGRRGRGFLNRIRQW